MFFFFCSFFSVFFFWYFCYSYDISLEWSHSPWIFWVFVFFFFCLICFLFAFQVWKFLWRHVHKLRASIFSCVRLLIRLSSAFKFLFSPYFVCLSFTFYSFLGFSSLCLQAPSVLACCPRYPLEHRAYPLQLFYVCSLLIPALLLHCVWFSCWLYLFKLFSLSFIIPCCFSLFVLDISHWIKIIDINGFFKNDIWVEGVEL